MTVIAANTLQIFRELEDAGMDKPVAQTLSDIIWRNNELLIEQQKEAAATKDDLSKAVQLLDKRIESSKNDLRKAVLLLEKRIESSKAETIKWVSGMLVGQLLAIIGALLALV